MWRLFLVPVGVISLAMTAAHAQPVSAYVGQESRTIKALSTEEVQSYRDGKGMGLAKAAELNGYPGPAHVLELAQKLGLTEEQRAQTQQLMTAMTQHAKQWGAALLEQERVLDQMFASGTITQEVLDKHLTDIAFLQAKIRNAHLSAHLEQVRILTFEQNLEYGKFRGYQIPNSSPINQEVHAH